jgi:hypothetical protein
VSLVLLLALLLPGASLAQAPVYDLAPSGGDDTAAIQAAFSAAAAHPGSVIRFAEGQFYIAGAVVADNLSGSVLGAGRDRTVINQIGEIVPGHLFGTVAIPGTGAVMSAMFLLNYTAGGYAEGTSLLWQGIGIDAAGPTEPWVHGWSGATMRGTWPVWMQGVGH